MCCVCVCVAVLQFEDDEEDEEDSSGGSEGPAKADVEEKDVTEDIKKVRCRAWCETGSRRTNRRS